MRLALLAALAAWVGLAEPAVALDKVKFATNWLANPEAGGFFQVVVDGAPTPNTDLTSQSFPVARKRMGR
jgi:hypothetical protein